VQIVEGLTFAANNNSIEVWSAMITLSGEMIEGYISAVRRVPFVVNVELLHWEKMTQSWKQMTHAGGLETIQNVEHVLQVMFNSTGKLDNRKARVVQGHYPYGLMQHMGQHPYSGPLTMRSSLFRAAYSREKTKCARSGYDGVLNLSEKSIDVCVKMVS